MKFGMTAGLSIRTISNNNIADVWNCGRKNTLIWKSWNALS